MPKSARVSAYPRFVAYCDPTLSEHAPRGGGWAHEIKADGYRAQVHVVEGKVIVYSRRGHDWTDQFGPSPKHDQAHAYCKALAERVAATDPDRYTTNATLIKRPGRLFIDYLRNGRGTTAIGTYSPRARPGFPIAAPVTWKQLQRGIRPDAFHMFSPFVSKDCDRCPRCCPKIEFNEGTVAKPLICWWTNQGQTGHWLIVIKTNT